MRISTDSEASRNDPRVEELEVDTPVKAMQVASYTTIVNRDGEITIPADIRRSLRLRDGDQVTFERQGNAVLIRPARSAAKQTVGSLAKFRLATPLSATEERASFEQAVAEEVARSEEA